MDKSKTYNVALANVLAEHYDVAGDILDDVNSGDAKSHYVRAILGKEQIIMKCYLIISKLVLVKTLLTKQKLKKIESLLSFLKTLILLRFSKFE